MSNSTAIQQAAKGRRVKLTDRQEQALQNFIDSGFEDPKASFIAAGYDPKTVHSAIRALRDEIQEIAEMFLVSHSPKAVKTILDVMTSEEGVAQAGNKLDAAKTVLDRIGLGKKDKVEVNHNVSGGIFILPSKDPIDDLIEVEAEVLD